MQNYRTEQIRNVTLLSHGGAGKTSLSEAMLFAAGAINRMGRVDEGTTTSDYDPDETKRKISINISLLPCEWQNSKVNVIDTPGYADFVGEVRAAVRVADAAVIVVCAASGVEVGTEQVWRYTEEQGLPRIIFVNKMDRENADFARTLEQLQSKFGARCAPLQIPIGAQDALQGVIDLISLNAYTKANPKGEAVPASMVAEVASLREKLIEAVAETDDNLITKYLEGEELTEEELRQGLRQGTADGKIVPVMAGAALQSVGVPQLLDAMVDLLPSPKDAGIAKGTNPNTKQEETLEPSESGPLATLVFKTTADPYVGKLTYFRVYSGTLKSDSQVWNANKGQPERIGQVFVMRGKNQEATPSLVAGDIGAVAKLAETSTGDTLCAREHPVTLSPIQFPNPIFSASIHPVTKVDVDKLGPALARICEEDPTLRMHRDPDTAETILSGMGESHVDVAAEKMKRKFGVDVKVEIPKVSYKETITMPTKAEYKHKKQTGGHGQYGHVFLELETLPRGSGFQFAEKVVGGVVPRNYIPGVEKGVVEAVQEGILAHHPVVDVKITLYDGSYHPVDSSEMAFKIAGSQATKKGLLQAQPVLLEPIMNLQVVVPDSFMGDVIGDLNGKRARVLGTIPQDGSTVIEAQAPLAEVLRYATDLRSMTQGRGTYTMEFSHYEEVPAHIAQKVIAEAKKEKEAVKA